LANRLDMIGLLYYRLCFDSIHLSVDSDSS
jgi:hypothetical protein